MRRLCGLSSGEHSDHTIGDEAADEITRLRAECERLREDAARYRWLRSQQPADGLGYKERKNDCVITFKWPKAMLGTPSLDSAIDAAVGSAK